VRSVGDAPFGSGEAANKDVENDFLTNFSKESPVIHVGVAHEKQRLLEKLFSENKKL